jgi:hypothetical protein
MVRRRGPTQSQLAVGIESFWIAGSKDPAVFVLEPALRGRKLPKSNNVIASAAKQSILTRARLHRVYVGARLGGDLQKQRSRRNPRIVVRQ